MWKKYAICKKKDNDGYRYCNLNNLEYNEKNIQSFVSLVSEFTKFGQENEVPMVFDLLIKKVFMVKEWNYTNGNKKTNDNGFKEKQLNKNSAEVKLTV